MIQTPPCTATQADRGSARKPDATPWSRLADGTDSITDVPGIEVGQFTDPRILKVVAMADIARPVQSLRRLTTFGMGSSSLGLFIEFGSDARPGAP